jgi:hypothetical protein
MILEHPTCDRDEDDRQQVKRQQGRLARAKKRLESANAPTPVKVVTLRQEAEEHEKKLKVIEAYRDSGSRNSLCA